MDKMHHPSHVYYKIDFGIYPVTTPNIIEFTLRIDAKGYTIRRDPNAKSWRGPWGWLELKWDELGLPAMIVEVGGRKIERPLDHYPKLLEEFAGVRTEDELLAFVTKYGPLTKRTGTYSPVDESLGAWKGDSVPHLLREAEFFRSQFKVRAAKLPVAFSLGDYTARLSKDLKI